MISMADIGETPEEREQQDLKDFATYIDNNGVAAITGEIQRRLDAWKSIDLNIGIIGATGVGKSSFINTMRRVKPTDPGGAATGVVQTTLEPTKYEHPHNSSVKLWDLPGVGTREFPRESYLEKIKFDSYDFFVIMSCSRFTEDDLWFANEIRQEKKRFYFVRTKADNDVRSDREDYPQAHNEERVLAQVKGNCIAELTKDGFTDQNVFLVCKNPLLYEFPALEEKLVTDLPALKQEAALLTLHSTSKRVIEAKTTQLQKRSWLVAVASGAVAAVPVPGLSVAVDIAILLGEHIFYKRVYGLDSEGLKQLSESAHVPEEKLLNAIKHNFWVNLTTGTLLRAMGSLGLGMAMEEGMKFIPIPILASIACSAMSFFTTKLFLRSSIASMERAALTVLDIAFSEASSKDM